MRSTLFIVTGLCTLTLASLRTVPSVGQTEAPLRIAPVAPRIEAAPTLPFGKWQISPEEKDQRFDLAAHGAQLVPLLEDLAQRAGKKVIISDAVRNKRVGLTFNLKAKSAKEILDYLAPMGGFTWDTAGDTWLIVERSTIPTYITMPQLTPPAPRSTDPFVIPRLPQPRTAPPGSQPFDFNGQQYYLVPIAPEKK